MGPMPSSSLLVRLAVSLGLLVLLSSASVAFGQASMVSGAVVDPQGNAVAGATITITSTVSGITRTVTTNSEGVYQIPQLAPGVYRVRAEAAGFASLVQEDVTVQVNTPLTLNLAFQVGAVNETVTVQGAESTINTTDATLGNTFNNLQVKELPLLSRNVVGLLSIQPGVTQAGYVNGGRADQANVTLDGVDVNDQQAGSAFFSVLRLTPDSLQEFRVVTTNANADQGRSSGAQVSLLTKSGTNDFHGSLYEFHRNTATSANNWFNNKTGVPREKLLRNNFGGAIGGPIKKDKLFFFFNYEGFRQASGTSFVRQVPLPTLGQGIVRYRTADGSSDPTCPAGTPSGVRCLNIAQINGFYIAANGVTPGINPAALSTLAAAAGRYKANDTTQGDQLNSSGFRFNASTPVTQNTAIARFDYNITEKQGFFARFNYQNDNSVTAATAARFPDTPAAAVWNHPRGLALGHTWTISNNLINTFKYGYTRDAFTQGGDAAQNLLNFRFVFQPLNFTYALSRTTPIHNFVDDLSWTKGSHSMQYGANVRLISNTRNNLGTSFDNASTNPSFYDLSGNVVYQDTNGNAIFPNVSSGSTTNLRDALTAIIGRFSQYGTNLNYSQDGSLEAAGTGVLRVFKTQEYEFYGQDSWRLRPNLTLTYGLRWSTSTPVYEANGVQVKPVQSLGGYFDQRVASAFNGVPYNAPITVDLAGKANGKGPYYDQDWNNFAPAVAFAWSPKPKSEFLRKVFGDGKSTIRGGFRMTYDRIGSQLAVAFDLNSTLGFKSSSNISANTFNVSDRLAPLYTGSDPNVRVFPGLVISPTLKFPQITPADESQRIESSLDDTLVTPLNYSFNMSYGRDLGKGFSFEASYVGRLARNLLVTRDVMHLNNIRDPQSGVDWYTGIRQLIAMRYQSVPITSVPAIPFFEHFFPGLAGVYSVLGKNVTLNATQAAYRRIAFASVGGRNTTDYTTVQALWNDAPIALVNSLFFQPQYAALSTFSTVGSSDYHGLQVSLRKRFSQNLTFDFNYTMSHSLDVASGLQSATSYGSAFIVNPLDLDSQRANSDFDIRHLLNANWIAAMPFGHGQKFLGDTNKFVNGVIGGWELSGIFRYNTGLPSGQPFDASQWATNWNVQSNAVALRTVEATPTRTGDPNLFSNPTAAFQSYRNALPGETGDRNILRFPGFFGIDVGLYKSFKITERVHLQFRWETFNVTNTQTFTTISSFGLPQDPNLGATPSPSFGKFTAIQGTPRQMQFALRLEF